MADKTPTQLTAANTLGDTDLMLVYPLADAVLKKVAVSVLLDRVLLALGSTVALVANNLSDLASATTARANLGLGTAATMVSSAFFQVANNLSEIGNAATARTNLGAAASASPTITGGMTLTGSTKQNVQALAALDIDVSIGEFFTKSISTNSTFTFSNPTAAKVQGFILELTVSLGADPTWPAAVDWAGGVEPPFPDGKNYVGFLTLNGGTNWVGVLGPAAVA